MKKSGLLVLVTTAAVMNFTAVSADQNNAGHKWVPKHPVNPYWQSPPEYSGFDRQPAVPQAKPQQAAPSQMAPQGNQYWRPAPSAQYGGFANQAQPAVRNTRPPRYAGDQPPAQNMRQPRYSGDQSPARQVVQPSAGQGGYPPPRGPYNTSSYPYDNGASAFYTPGYNRYRDGRKRYNKFWGDSGPRTWMNPSKDNWERGWDDMINAPSRMGTMPGGWNAPEVSMPNPVDMADQMQDNAKDLPEQIRDMNVGNEVTD